MRAERLLTGCVAASTAMRAEPAPTLRSSTQPNPTASIRLVRNHCSHCSATRGSSSPASASQVLT